MAISYRNYKSWKDEDEDNDEELFDSGNTSSDKSPSYSTMSVERYKAWKEGDEDLIFSDGKKPSQEAKEERESDTPLEKKKGVFQKVGDFIKKLTLGEKEEGDKRNDWQRFQEEFIGFESKAGKQNREELQEYYDNLKTGKEKADTEQEILDLTKIKAYEVLKGRAEEIENMAEGEKKTYSVYKDYDSNDKEIREYSKKHPFVTIGQLKEKFPDKTFDRYYEKDKETGEKKEITKEEYEKRSNKAIDYEAYGDIKDSLKILGDELGMTYVSKGVIPEALHNIDTGFAKGNAFNDEGSTLFTESISTTGLKKANEAVKKAEKDGWDSLNDNEKANVMIGYVAQLQGQQTDQSFMDKVLELQSNSLGWGSAMATSASLAGGQGAGVAIPEALGTGITKIVQTAGIEAVKAMNLAPLYTSEIEKKYLNMTTPEYAYFVDKAGDIVIEKLEEARNEEGEGTMNKARLSNYLEVFSESWGNVLGVGAEEFMNSLVKTKVFNNLANWMRKSGKLTQGSLSKLLKEGTLFDGVVGEWLEEELLNPIQSKLENTDYVDPFTTKEGRERALIEFLGFGATQTGAMIQGYMQNKNKRKAIDYINNNKEKFGLGEDKELDKDGNLFDVETGEVIVPKEEVTKEPDPIFGVDLKEMLQEDLKDMEAEIEGEEVGIGEDIRKEKTTYIEEGDLTQEGFNEVQQEELAKVITELQSDIEAGARKKLVTPTEDGEYNIAVEGAVLPEYIPEELRSREIIQEAVDSLLTDSTVQEGTKAWQVQQMILEEAVSRSDGVSKVEIEEPDIDTKNMLLEDVKKVWNKTSGADAFPNISEDLKKAETVEDFFRIVKDNTSNATIESFGVALDTYYGTKEGQARKEEIEAKKKEKKEAKKEKKKEPKKEEEKGERPPHIQKGIELAKKVSGRVEAKNMAMEVVRPYLDEGAEQFIKTRHGQTLPDFIGHFSTGGYVNEKKIKRGNAVVELADGRVYEFKVQDLFDSAKSDQITMDDLPFRVDRSGNEVLDTDKITKPIQDEISRLNNEIFGDTNIKVVEKLLTPSGRKALGKYEGDWISILNKQADPTDTYYHEAVHKALDVFLTTSEKSSLLSEVKNIYGEEELRKKWGNISTNEKLRLASYRDKAVNTYNVSKSVVRSNGIGVKSLAKNLEWQGNEELLSSYARSVGIDPNNLYASSVQSVDIATGERSIYLVDGEVDAIHAQSLIDNSQFGIAGEKLDGKIWHITALKKADFTNPFTIIEGKFDPKTLPYSKNASTRSDQREYRLQFGIAKTGNKRGIDGDVYTNKQVAEYLMSVGTHDGNGALEDIQADDFLITDMINKDSNYELVDVDVDWILENNSDIAKVIKQNPDAYLSDREYVEDESSYDSPVIISSDGEIIDGTGRVTGHYVNGDEKIQAYVGIGTKFRGDTLKGASIDAMAEEQLAEDIIAYVNETKTFFGRMKRMIENFIERMFKGVEGKQRIDNFYKGMLSGKYLKEQKKAQVKLVKTFYDTLGTKYRQINPNMLLLHNTRFDKLTKAVDAGGLSVPSLAMIKEGQGFDSFGDITLVMSKDIVNFSDPAFKAYSGDIYSPRVPVVTYKISEPKGEIKQFIDELGMEIKEDISDTHDEYYARIKRYLRQNNLDWDSTAIHSKWKEIVDEIYGEPYITGRVEETPVEVEKKYSPSEIELIEQAFNNSSHPRDFELQLTNEYDTIKMFEAKTNKLDIDDYYDLVYELSELYYPKNEFSAENMTEAILDRMDREEDVVGQESMSAPLRVYGYKRFKSIDEIKEYADNLNMDEDFIKDTGFDKEEKFNGFVEDLLEDDNLPYILREDDLLNDDFFKSEVLRYYNAHDNYPDVSDLVDIYMTIMQRNGEDFEMTGAFEYLYDETEYFENLVAAYGDLPTEYFEAKVMRTVDFGEVEEVIVPKERVDKVRELLKGKVSANKISGYDSTKEGARTEILSKIVRENKEAKFREEGMDEKAVKIELPELFDLAESMGTDVTVFGGFRKAGKQGDFSPIGEGGRIRINRDMFTPKGEIVTDPETGEEIQLPETVEERMERVLEIEKTVSHEIGHLADWFGGEDNKTLSRGNILGRIGNLVKYMEKEFRGYENKTIRNELKALTHIWNPFDADKAPAKYKSYRYSAKELYAEAMSVMLNDPALIKRTAPEFYQGFVEFLNRKEEFKNNLFNILDNIKSGTNVEKRLEKMDKGFEEGRGRRMTIEEKKEARKRLRKWEDAVSDMKTGLVSIYEPYLKKLRDGLKDKGITLSQYEENEQVLQNLQFIGNDTVKYSEDVQKEFIDPITEADISLDDVGKILVLERNLGDRLDLANPDGLIYDYAQETYDLLKEKLGVAKWNILEERLKWWREYNFKWVEEGYESGIYSKEFFDEIATVNKNTYTPFAVVKYIEDNYVTAGVIQAKGTKSQVENPLTTHMLKTISIIKASAVNKAKGMVVGTLKDNFEEDIIKAEAVRGDKGRFVAWKRNKQAEAMGLKIIELKEDGKRVGYYVDDYIKQMFDSPNGIAEWSLAYKVLIAPIRAVNRIFKPAVTVLKPSFQFYSNPIKDYKRSLVNATALARMFDDANGGVVKTSSKVFRAFTREWFANLKRSWDYASGRLDDVTQQMLDMYVISKDIRYEDIELGNKEFSFDPVKNRVVYKSRANWFEGIMDKTRKIPLLKNVARVWDLYSKLGSTLEVNSKIAGFQYLKKEVGEKKAAYYTRQYIGTPNYMQKGKLTPIMNELAVFSNVGIQALNADSKLATSPKTASGYWFSTVITRVLPKLLMFAGASLLKVSIPDPDDPDKEKKVNPYDYLSEYYKAMYTAFPVGYDEETGKFLFFKVPNDEVGGVVGNLVWKMATYLSGEGMKIEQLGQALFGMIPLLNGDNPATGLLSDWLGYMQGRNPYDDFRGRLAINTSKWDEGGTTRFVEMMKWSTNELGLTNFQTYDKEFNTTKEVVLEAPLIERMFELSNYGLQEKEEHKKDMGKQEKKKDLSKLIEDFYAEPSDAKMLEKIDEYIVMQKGQEPEEGWSGDDKAEATRLRQEFKREILQTSANKVYKAVSRNGLTNDEREDKIEIQRKTMEDTEFNEYLTQLVRYEIVKGEFLADYLSRRGASDELVYQIATQSLSVLPSSNSNTLFWEMRKTDVMSDEVLRQIYDDGYITPKAYKKYRPVNSEWYEKRYSSTSSNSDEDLF